MSSINPYFDEKVRGRVRAELILDKDGNPEFLEGNTLNHYKIRLYLQTQNPDVQRVIYRLDPTYYDPVRDSNDASRKFELSLTTYGDYQITIDVQVKGEIVREVFRLSTLLNEIHGQSENNKIQAALEAIEAH